MSDDSWGGPEAERTSKSERTGKDKCPGPERQGKLPKPASNEIWYLGRKEKILNTGGSVI